MRLIIVLAAISISMVYSEFASAQKGQKVTLPPPLVVMDATGKVAGRYIDNSGNIGNVVISVNGANTVVKIVQDHDASGAYLSAARWIPSSIAYFPTADCSGLPLVNAMSGETIAPGFRASHVFFDANGLVLRLAVAGPSSLRSHQSYGYPRCDASGVCQVTGCVVESKTEQQGWNVETTINLNQTYPGPLTVQ